MKKVSFHTLGCKVNFAESSTMAREYVARGFERVGENSPADVYVVNSCSVTAAADKKCRNLIAKLHRRSPDAQIVVAGCYARRSPDEVAALPGVSTVVKRELDKFTPAYSAGDRTRSFLKVQDGCDYKCSYCTIHSARGVSRNASVVDLVAQAREIALQGVKEIVLTGVNTGDFGRTTGERFVDLVAALDAVDGIERYRISSIEPNLLTDEIIALCAASGKFQPHFHIPLQSGSDKILRAMCRRYTTEMFAGRLAKVREVMPDAFFGVDVIVGFPGETDADFEDTRRLVERVRPSELHVFPYSVRPGTPAAEMPGKVPPQIAARRASVLGGLSRALHLEFAAKHFGKPMKVLFEGSCRGGMMYGFTSNYIKVAAAYDAGKVNEIVEIVPERLDEANILYICK